MRLGQDTKIAGSGWDRESNADLDYRHKHPGGKTSALRGQTCRLCQDEQRAEAPNLRCANPSCGRSADAFEMMHRIGQGLALQCIQRDGSSCPQLFNDAHLRSCRRSWGTADATEALAYTHHHLTSEPVKQQKERLYLIKSVCFEIGCFTAMKSRRAGQRCTEVRRAGRY